MLVMLISLLAEQKDHQHCEMSVKSAQNPKTVIVNSAMQIVNGALFLKAIFILMF